MDAPPPRDNTGSELSLSDVESDVADEEEEACETGSTSELCVSQQVYLDSGNNKKVLYILCLGLTDITGGAPLFSLDKEPWVFLPKHSLRPRNTEYTHEILRRANLYNIVPMPRPSNWTRTQIMEWFERYPVKEEEDIHFLQNEVLRLQEVVARVHEQNRRRHGSNTPVYGRRGGASGATSGAGGRKWRGVVPYLRIIMCLAEDNVKCLYLTRANARSRHELDARNSDTRYETTCVLIAPACF